MSSANSAALWKQNKETLTTQSRQCVTSTTTAEDFTGSGADGAAGVGSAGGGDADCAGSDTEQATTRSAPRSAPRGAEVAVEAHPTRKCSRPPQEPPPKVRARRDASAARRQRAGGVHSRVARGGCLRGGETAHSVLLLPTRRPPRHAPRARGHDRIAQRTLQARCTAEGGALNLFAKGARLHEPALVIKPRRRKRDATRNVHVHDKLRRLLLGARQSRTCESGGGRAIGCARGRHSLPPLHPHSTIYIRQVGAIPARGDDATRARASVLLAALVDCGITPHVTRHVSFGLSCVAPRV